MIAYLRFFKIRSLFSDNVSQQLIFQSLSGDSEVDQCGLRLHLWFVMRICKLGLKDQTEIRMVFDLFVSKFDVSIENVIIFN